MDKRQYLIVFTTREGEDFSVVCGDSDEETLKMFDLGDFKNPRTFKDENITFLKKMLVKRVDRELLLYLESVESDIRRGEDSESGRLITS